MSHKLSTITNTFFWTVALVLVTTATSVSAQQTASQRSYQQARRVLDDGVQAMGGLEALRSVKDFTLKEKGKVYARYQSPTPQLPYTVGTSEETLTVDNDRGLLFDDAKAANGGFNNWVTTIINGSEGHTLDMWSRTDTPIVNPSINNFRGLIRRMPVFVLLEALDRAATLRYVGEDSLGGKKQKVISVIRPDNQLLSLFFDAKSNLLSRYEYLYADPMAGDSVIAQSYPAYRAVGDGFAKRGRGRTERPGTNRRTGSPARDRPRAKQASERWCGRPPTCAGQAQVQPRPVPC